MSNRSATQSVRMKIGRTGKASANDHAVSRAHSIVADRTVNVVALMAPLQHRPSHRVRKDRGVFAVYFPGIKQRILAQLPARDGPLHRGPSRAPIRKKVARLERLDFGLIFHSMLK